MLTVLGGLIIFLILFVIIYKNRTNFRVVGPLAVVALILAVPLLHKNSLVIKRLSHLKEISQTNEKDIQSACKQLGEEFEVFISYNSPLDNLYISCFSPVPSQQYFYNEETNSYTKDFNEIKKYMKDLSLF